MTGSRLDQPDQQDDACVEVAATAQSIVARDSKVADSPVLGFGVAQWDGFMGALHVRRDA